MLNLEPAKVCVEPGSAYVQSYCIVSEQTMSRILFMRNRWTYNGRDTAPVLQETLPLQRKLQTRREH